MKLIHIYIHTYKHLKDLNIHLHGGFECFCTDNKLKIRKSKTLDDYYDGLSIQGIIGKNGVGKSTILELICNTKPDYSQQYLLVWLDDDNCYRVNCNYYDLDEIDADTDATIHIGIENNITSIVNINNISNPFTYTQRTSSRVSFLTPSTYKSEHANRRRQYTALSNYFSYSNHYPDEVRPRYYISLNKLRESDIRRVLNVIMKDQSAYELLIKSLRPNGVLNLENIFLTIMNYSPNLVRSNIYLTSCIQLVQEYPYIDGLNSSFQHCAGLTLFITLIKNRNYKLQESIDEWSYRVYPEFKNISLSYKNEIKKNKLSPKPHSISAQIIDNYIYNIEFYLAGNNFKVDVDDDTATKIYIDSPGEIHDFLSKSKNEFYDFSSIISYGWDGLSSGELAKSLLLANIYHYVRQCDHANCHLILIDEIDLYLHPEWQRKIINDIISLVRGEISTSKLQFIITSHSPIIISDLLPENIVNIDRTQSGEINIKKSPGYATQISDLYLSGMHISSTFGELVHSTLTKIMNKNGILSDSDKAIISRIKSRNIRRLLGSE
ncbi:AAA family ATPase [Aeromonas veronii]|uniref:AAA family ATPase n=1 Tax=Aeromonas veronii TaxID=654 RepID=UPI003D2123F6